MKKKLALTLVAALVLGTFVGCTAPEVSTAIPKKKGIRLSLKPMNE